MNDPVFIAVAGAVVGLLIGYFTGRRLSPGSYETRQLEEQLADARSTQERYEQRVNEHFADTANKLNALTNNYREVYAHIASGASELCPKAENLNFSALAAPGNDGHDTIDADSVMVEAPRDYAPKTSPEDPGVLNERFGMDGSDVPPEDSSTRS
jgi:uncharacterized membrane-anchored protein YhcB (DUF1043 family)